MRFFAYRSFSVSYGKSSVLVKLALPSFLKVRSAVQCERVPKKICGWRELLCQREFWTWATVLPTGKGRAGALRPKPLATKVVGGLLQTRWGVAKW